MNPVTMKVVVTGRPYHLADAAEVAVVVEVADAVVAEEGAGPGVAAEGAEGMPSSFQCTRKAGLPNHRIGPSSLHL